MTFPALPWEFWGTDNLSIISSILGKPLFSDQCTKNRTRLAYARVIVEMEMGGEYPDQITLEDGNGVQFNQKVYYELKPIA